MPAFRRLHRRLRAVLTTGAVALPVLACEDLAVNPLRVFSVEIEPETATVSVGESRVLEAHLFDAAGRALTGYDVAWGTNRPDIVFIGENGRVTGIRAGYATITAVAGGTAGEANMTVLARSRPARPAP
jgi:uncharacterized protein YjdB